MLGVDPVTVSLGGSLGLAFLFLGGALFAAIAALSHAHERAFSAAMIYLALGAGAGGVVRVFGVGRLATPLGNHEVLEFVSDGALALGLFATGMRIRRRPTLRRWQLSLRLIGVAVPETVALVALWGAGLIGLGRGAAIALGAALAPTDPVLAGDLGVGPPQVDEEEEEPPEPEFVLTAEAGMNDGSALPFLFLGLAVARGDSLWAWAATKLVYGVVAGIVVGAALGWGIGLGASRLRERDFLSSGFDRWVGLAAAFAVYGAAEAIGAYGFLAAFAGGVAFRRHELEGEYRREVHDGASVIMRFAELTVILILGSTLTLGGFDAAGGLGIALAPVTVFAIRPLTAFVTLLATSRLTFRERLWVSWFGVKGVASLNYAAIVAGAAAVFGRPDAAAVVWVVLTTVTLSIVVHGVTSTGLTRRLLDNRAP